MFSMHLTFKNGICTGEGVVSRKGESFCMFSASAGGCGIAAVVAAMSSSPAAGAPSITVRDNASKLKETTRHTSKGHLKISILNSLRLKEKKIKTA